MYLLSCQSFHGWVRSVNVGLGLGLVSAGNVTELCLVACLFLISSAATNGCESNLTLLAKYFLLLKTSSKIPELTANSLPQNYAAFSS